MRAKVIKSCLSGSSQARLFNQPGDYCIDDQQQRMKKKTQGPSVGNHVDADEIKQHSQGEVAEKPVEVVLHREKLLPEEVRKDHHRAVADKGGPGRSEVSMDEVIGAQRDPPEIQGEGDHGADQRKPGAPYGFRGEFVPDREVVIDSEKQVGHHEDGDDPFALPVIFSDEVTHDEIIEVNHGGQEDEGDHHDEIIHDAGIQYFGIFFLCGGEEEGFGRVFIGLDEDGHQDRDFVAGAVDPHLVGGDAFGQQVPEEDAVEGFVDNARHSGKEQGKGIDQHGFQELPVDFPPDPGILRDQQDEGQDAGDEVGDKDILNSPVGPVNQADESAEEIPRCMLQGPGTEKQEEQVQQEVDRDVGQVDGDKPDRLVLRPEQGKGDLRQCIEAKKPGKPEDILGVIGIVDPPGDVGSKEGGQAEEDHRGDDQRDHGGTENAGFVAFIFMEPEEGGLHTVGKDHRQEGGIGIKHAHRAIFSRQEDPCVDGHQQIAQQASQDAR